MKTKDIVSLAFVFLVSFCSSDPLLWVQSAVQRFSPLFRVTSGHIPDSTAVNTKKGVQNPIKNTKKKAKPKMKTLILMIILLLGMLAPAPPARAEYLGQIQQVAGYSIEVDSTGKTAL